MTLVPFRIDFSMNRGHVMLLDREAGISRKELDDIELQMLQSQRIPHVLPIDWLELDGQVTFRYKLDGVKMLRHRLQLQSITMSQFYAILLGVADVLDDCRSYMMKPEGFLLEEPYIFTGEQLHDVRLVYVPMKITSLHSSTGVSSLLALVVKLMAYVEEPDGEGLKRILQHTASVDWPIAELKALLLEMIGKAGSVQEPSNAIPQLSVQSRKLQAEEHSQSLRQQPQDRSGCAEPIKSPLHTHEAEANTGAVQAEISQPAKSWRTAQNHPENSLVYQSDDQHEDDLEDSMYERSLKGRSHMKWLTASMVLIAVACVWRFVYLSSKSSQSLLISAGVTLLLIALPLLLSRKRSVEPFEWANAEDEGEEEDEDNDVRSYVSAYAKQSPSLPTESSVPALAAASAAIRVVEPTVLMGIDSDERREPVDRARFWLQRSWEGKEQRIDLKKGSFRIGRTGDKLDFSDDASNVSRLHLEIESGDDGHLAKDVGSRNGSLLNGQTMIAYKSYKLSLGDVIHLAGADGPAYEVKSG